MSKVLMGMLVCISLILGGCTTTQTPTLSQMQMREMTTKEIEGNYKNVYQSTMSILQDNGYVISATDYNSGLISAIKEVEKNPSASEIIFLSIEDVTGQVMVSATVHEVTKNLMKVRINIQEKTIKRKYNGGEIEDVVNIQTPDTYNKLFSQINIESKRRSIQ